MSLYFELKATSMTGAVTIGTVQIRRLEPLERPADPEEEVHNYEVTVDGRVIGSLEHRYGDGAWHLAHKATALISFAGYAPHQVAR